MIHCGIFYTGHFINMVTSKIQSSKHKKSYKYIMTDYAIKSHLQSVQQSTGQTEVMTLGIEVSKDSPDKEKITPFYLSRGSMFSKLFLPGRVMISMQLPLSCQNPKVRFDHLLFLNALTGPTS